MADRQKDAPWAFVSERPDLPGASRPIPGDLPAIKPGERLSVKNPQHRTKGAKGSTGYGLVKKRYRTSDRPAGWTEANADEKFIGQRLNARQRRDLRRKLEGKF